MGFQHRGGHRFEWDLEKLGKSWEDPAHSRLTDPPETHSPAEALSSHLLLSRIVPWEGCLVRVGTGSPVWNPAAICWKGLVPYSGQDIPGSSRRHGRQQGTALCVIRTCWQRSHCTACSA